jgi:hypothetical protein
MLNDNRTFDAKAVALLLETFDEIVADLDLRVDADREKAAKIVLRLAHGQTELDAAKIRAEVVRLMRREGAGRRRPFRTRRSLTASRSKKGPAGASGEGRFERGKETRRAGGQEGAPNYETRPLPNCSRQTNGRGVAPKPCHPFASRRITSLLALAKAAHSARPPGSLSEARSVRWNGDEPVIKGERAARSAGTLRWEARNAACH